MKATESLSPEERAEYLETDDKFGSVHSKSAKQGQTEVKNHRINHASLRFQNINVRFVENKAPDIENDVDLHYIAFVHKDGDLYELDGAKPFPLNHGASSPDCLLEVRHSLTPKPTDSC
jgi:ubiquitin carboxyl-terminal hydrolase L3